MISRCPEVVKAQSKKHGILVDGEAVKESKFGKHGLGDEAIAQIHRPRRQGVRVDCVDSTVAIFSNADAIHCAGKIGK